MLVTKNFDPECLDSAGKPAMDPEKADLFSFDFVTESGNDYGTVVVMIGDDNDLQIYFGDNLGKGMEGQDKQAWFDFLYDLKRFATKNLMSFSPKNLNRLKYTMQGMAALKEGLFESWTGTRTQSWNGLATEARLMIRHKRPLGENDARFRYVESLFIETAEGERYKLPFTKLSGGRAMVEHVRQGGRPYDARGQHIAEMVSEINVLSRFRRANHGKIFEGDTATLVTETDAYYENLQSRLKGLGKSRDYTEYFESWDPNVITEEEVVVEGLKHLFVTQSLDTRIEDALPLLAKIQQQGQAMKEANIFESWANNLMEGTWAIPDTPEKQQELVELLSKDFPVGPDATNATEQLYDLLGDDELFDQLEALAQRDADADCRQVVYDRMQMLSDDPDVKATLDALQIDPTAAMNPAGPTDADASATNEENLEDVESIGGDASDKLMADVMTNQRGVDVYEDDLDEILKKAGVPGTPRPAPDYESTTLVKENVTLDESGSTLQHILDTFKRDVKDFKETGEVSRHLHDALYDYYHDDMPYGVQKARDGDPYEWVADRFGSDLGLPGYGSNSPGVPDEDYGIERESVMHGDYAEEKSRMRKLAGIQDEGVLGTLAGGLAGGALGGPLGAVAGAGLGQAATSGGSGIIEGDDDKDSGSFVAPALAGGALGYAAGSGALDGVGSTIAGLFSEGDDEETDEGVLGTAVGTGLGALAGGVPGAVIGGLAGSALTSDDKEETDEDWKGQLAGGTAGTIAGELGGAVVGGPVGALVGGALGGTAGGMAGKKLGDMYGDDKEETDEGVLGTLAGGLAGGALGGPLGAVAGAGLGQAATSGGSGIIEQDNEETDEGIVGSKVGGALGKKFGTAAGVAGANAAKKAGFDIGKMALARAGRTTGQALGQEIGDIAGTALTNKIRSKLQGQYGHSGKLEPVADKPDFLTRLKELSGMIRSK
jgi:hypothetical protein